MPKPYWYGMEAEASTAMPGPSSSGLERAGSGRKGKKSKADSLTPNPSCGTSARIPATSSFKKRVRCSMEPPYLPALVLAPRNSWPK